MALRFLTAAVALVALVACARSNGGAGPNGEGGTGVNGGEGAGVNGGEPANGVAMGGSGGDSEVAPSTCAEQLLSGPSPCAHGEWSTGTVVEGADFANFEGSSVHLTFINENDQTLEGTSTVVDGSFRIDVFQPAPGTCRLGVEMAGGALYVDSDGNGECDPALDWLFVWSPQANPGTCQPVAISPTSARCGLANPLSQLASQNVLLAAQALCPKVGACLDFCPEPPEEVSGASQPFCPTGQGGAGGADSMGGAGVGGSGDGGSG